MRKTVVATLKLNIDITGAEEMGYEIDDPKEYALEEMIEWIHQMTRTNELAECIHTEIVEEKQGDSNES